MQKSLNYHDELNKKNILKLREILETLPSFCKQFFRGIDDTAASRTKLAYAYDLRIFFEFIHESNSVYRKMDITDYPLRILDELEREDIEEYMEYLSYYVKGGVEFMNDERGKKRKLSSLRSFYNYFYRNQMISKNPAVLVPMPKLHEKEIVRMEPNEVAILLDEVEDGSTLTKREQRYHEKTRTRDLALLTLLLGTGMRVSECVGIDLNDVDFDNQRVKVRRKGGYEDVIYFGEEVTEALLGYLEERELLSPLPGHEEAFFLSIQNRRITVRSVENLVKKYTSRITTVKKITPHKLRSTYGTNLYQETGDIYLVADVLGHKDVNTTRKHYAAMKDENKRRAAKALRLREDL